MKKKLKEKTIGDMLSILKYGCYFEWITLKKSKEKIAKATQEIIALVKSKVPGKKTHHLKEYHQKILGTNCIQCLTNDSFNQAIDETNKGLDSLGGE